MTKSDEAKLAALRQKMDQIKAKAQAVEARQRSRERRTDTRRKIVLGGALLAEAERDPRVSAWVRHLVERVSRPADRKVFEGWTQPRARPGPQAGGGEGGHGV